MRVSLVEVSGKEQNPGQSAVRIKIRPRVGSREESLTPTYVEPYVEP